MSQTETHPESPRGKHLLLLSLTALGIVYGDIGTSPLYAMRECFHGPHAVLATRDNILGVLSLIFWSLILVISIKYLIFVLRADNRGEGGIIALMSLIRPRREARRGRRWRLVALGLFGAALLYGDGMITPAISVLSAVEGLKIATHQFEPYVIPITIVILVALFLFQRRGTAGIGTIFGPVTMIWFTVLAVLGISQIVHAPEVFAAVNPWYGAQFFALNEWRGFLVLGSVFLVVTGGEALYADIGHFGTLPIRITWFSLVLPSLLLNYFGQGALLLRNPAAAVNPFYRMAPEWALYPLVVIATAATVIASQAVISGSFSLTRQAIQLGYMPRMKIEHTSATEIGQIYVPAINWTLMIACIGLVLGFRDSSSLAAAYGVAVSTDMVFTTILLTVVMIIRWRWVTAVAVGLGAIFLIVDLAFFTANITKVPQGGWYPLVVALAVFTLMTTWKRGRQILDERLRRDALPIDLFLSSVRQSPPIRVPGIAVFMYRNPDGTPPALLHNLKHNKVLHHKVVLLTVVTEETPHVPEEERTEIATLGEGLFRVVAHYGFMEDPDVPAVLSRIEYPDLDFQPEQTSYFLGRETLLATKQPGMAIWRERLFAWMSRNALAATYFFRLPPNRVVELGAQIEL
ncbi:MAG TPA: potassium transporter Kup [Thermoanaerobaculia bacterium]|nr:potassium transporter Kup [Thermoanaerobaculia bacterium]